MREIYSIKGERYSYDESTGRIFKDGVLLPTSEAEPVFSGNGKENVAPTFSGILLKNKGMLLSLSGKENPITDSNII